MKNIFELLERDRTYTEVKVVLRFFDFKTHLNPIRQPTERT